MPYNQEHMLLAWEGTFRSDTTHDSLPLEYFAGSLRFAGPGLDQSNNLNVCGSLALVLTNYWRQTTSFMPANTFIEAVKWNKIGTDGKYTNGGSTQGIIPAPVGGGGSRIYPYQIAQATTWTTDATRGRACRGRTFWPTATPMDQSEGGIGTPGALARARVDATLIKRLNYAARNGFVDGYQDGSQPPAWLVAIGWTPGAVREGSGMSASVMSKLGTGTTRVITGAAVGRRLDVQRRRGKDVSDTRSQVQTTDAPD